LTVAWKKREKSEEVGESMQILQNKDIIFPYLGIHLHDVPFGFSVFGYYIALYGLVIGIGMLLGWLMVEWMAKKTGQNQEIYLDFTLIVVIISVVCARIYYVIFAFGEFKDNLWSIFNTRTGGLAIYGGVIGGVLTAFIFAKVRKYPFWLLVDTSCIGLVTGQIIGRWGNFFNREAFGKYTNGPFAMRLNIKDVPYDFRAPINELQEKFAGRTAAYQRIMEIRNHMVTMDGAQYIQVHPTFLYECLWNIGLLVILVSHIRYKKFDGEIILLYMMGYGIGRLWMEGLRTDQLFLWGTPIAVSQLLSGLIAIAAFGLFLYKWKKIKKKSNI
jgi:phosphatidylglycerol:prolipoprotein diacylglycerol transferase